jgi:lysozyme family protein
MRENFDKVHPWVLAHEGGYVNHPKDPGGATNFGVTQRTYNAYRKRSGQSVRSVKDISATERDAIYKIQYWDKLSCDELPSGLDYAVYDFGVNSGVRRSAKYLQRIVGTTQDGVIGLETLEAVDARSPIDIIQTLCNDRMKFLRSLAIWPTFKNGWTRRVVGKWEGVQMGDHGVIDRAAMLANRATDIPAPKRRKDGSGQRAVAKKPNLFGIIMGFLRGLKK